MKLNHTVAVVEDRSQRVRSSHSVQRVLTTTYQLDSWTRTTPHRCTDRSDYSWMGLRTDR